jgi:hypothetical protein
MTIHTLAAELLLEARHDLARTVQVHERLIPARAVHHFALGVGERVVDRDHAPIADASVFHAPPYHPLGDAM